MTCYERLEFIGDAILDFRQYHWSYKNGPHLINHIVVIRHIFYRDGKLSPGSLTLLKASCLHENG